MNVDGPVLRETHIMRKNGNLSPLDNPNNNSENNMNEIDSLEGMLLQLNSMIYGLNDDSPKTDLSSIPETDPQLTLKLIHTPEQLYYIIIIYKTCCIIRYIN